MGIGHCLELCNDDETAQGLLECVDGNGQSRIRDDYTLDFTQLRCADGLDQYANDCFAPCESGWHGE